MQFLEYLSHPEFEAWTLLIGFSIFVYTLQM